MMLITASFAVEAAPGGKGGWGVGPAASPGPTGLSGRGGATGLYRQDPRRAPPLDPERKVSEQDCTKPLDLSAGNLRCK